MPFCEQTLKSNNMKTPLQFRKCIALFSLVLLSFHSRAQVATLIQDINAGAGSSSPTLLTYCSSLNCFLFVANDGITGSELWKYDITSGVTSQVRDINPGAGSSSITAMMYYPVANVVVFGATDGFNGIELWKSDGTNAGTSMLMDINPGSASSSPNNFDIFSAKLIFSADNGTNGKEPWITNATIAGTTLLKDINPGVNASDPNLFTVSNGFVFFRANDGTDGSELWKTDMTSAGTVLVKDIFPGSQPSVPQNLVDLNNTLYFSANDPTNGVELWKSDGTTANTVLVKDINAGTGGSMNLSIPKAFFTAFNNNLYFQATNGTSGYELWKSDGTAAGTTLVKDINSGSGSSNPSGILATSSMMYLVANDGPTGYEVWTSDGTAAGTTQLKDISSGSASSTTVTTTFLSDASGTVYFAANDAVAGLELWKTNGSAVSTTLAADINPGAGNSSPANMITSANILYFSADNGTIGNELYKFGPVSAGVSEIGSENAQVSVYPNPFSTKLSIRVKDNSEYSVKVMNALGEQVISKEKISRNEALDLSDQANGVYMIIMSSSTQTLVKKVVKGN